VTLMRLSAGIVRLDEGLSVQRAEPDPQRARSWSSTSINLYLTPNLVISGGPNRTAHR